MEKKDISDTDIIEALVAISIVAKSLAKKVMIQPIQKDKGGGEGIEPKGCCKQDSNMCK